MHKLNSMTFIIIVISLLAGVLGALAKYRINPPQRPVDKDDSEDCWHQ